MKDTSSSSVLVLLFLIIFATAGIILFAATTRSGAYTVNTDASELTSISCPVKAHITLLELDENGNELPFVFSRNNTDPGLWGLADTINLPPYGDTLIPFNTPDVAEYTVHAPDLSFLHVPADDQIYPSEQIISLTDY